MDVVLCFAVLVSTGLGWRDFPCRVCMFILCMHGFLQYKNSELAASVALRSFINGQEPNLYINRMKNSGFSTALAAPIGTLNCSSHSPIHTKGDGCHASRTLSFNLLSDYRLNQPNLVDEHTLPPCQ